MESKINKSLVFSVFLGVVFYIFIHYYFNEDLFIYHEDLDLGWRLWLQAFRCLLAPQSVVYHKYDFSRSISKYYYMERNRYIVSLQNYKVATLIILLPAWLAMELGLLAFSLFSGFWKDKLKTLVVKNIFMYRYITWGKSRISVELRPAPKIDWLVRK